MSIHMLSLHNIYIRHVSMTIVHAPLSHAKQRAFPLLARVPPKSSPLKPLPSRKRSASDPSLSFRSPRSAVEEVQRVEEGGSSAEGRGKGWSSVAKRGRREGRSGSSGKKGSREAEVRLCGGRGGREVR